MLQKIYSDTVSRTHAACVFVLLAFFVSFPLAYGQDAEPGSKPPSGDPLLQPIPEDGQAVSAAEQSKLVTSIYEATKFAKSLKQCTALVEQCDRALEKKLNAKNRAYIASIKGWALCQRGEKHLEQAQQYKGLGSVNRYQSAFELAMDDLDASLIQDSKRHRSWNARGRAHVVHQDWQKAISDFTEATKLKPDFGAAWFNCAEACFYAGNYQQALDNYETVLRLNSDDLEAVNGCGLCHLSMKKFAAAIECFQAVIDAQPKLPQSYINCGDTYLAWGKWKESQEQYQRAVEMGKEDKQSQVATRIAQQRLAWLLATCPKNEIAAPDRALELINEVIQADGESPRRLETLAAATAATGKFKAAAETQKNAIRMVEFTQQADESDAKVRLSLYEQGRAYQLPPANAATTEQPTTEEQSKSTEKK